MLKFIAWVFVLVFSSGLHDTDGREFKIDYENNTFLMDGTPFRYVSGSVHYFRMPRQYWRDRLRKVRAAGLNVVSTYVEWSQHESTSGEYNFEGDLNITEFITTAEQEGLYVILRPGPYICAERDMGGLPYWLLKKHPDSYLRSSDPTYTKYANRWIEVVLREVSPLLYGNGGPIIMVQVENEYGSYPACDRNYTESLRDLFHSHVQDKALLFTTDGGATSFLKCGKIKGVYATVDFGPSTNITSAFTAQRIYEPKGPLVNSEFYPGWLTHWGEGMAHVDTNDVEKSLRKMLMIGANINFYMFYGGTNFGFTAGANMGTSYQADITSYDYDAPITEAGDLTEKYYMIKRVVSEYLPPSNLVVADSQKADYGILTLVASAGLFEPDIRSSLGRFTIGEYPLNFETLGQNYGYMLYETVLPTPTAQNLVVGDFHDYATIYINKRRIGTLSREMRTNTINISSSSGDILSIVVENLGRINYGIYNNDTKGILTNVTLGGDTLLGWNMTSFELKSIKPIENYHRTKLNSITNLKSNGFLFYVAYFDINSAHDTYLDVSNLLKGLVFINGHNLGRYWTTRGPQKTLYVPGVFLIEGMNSIVILEEELQLATLTVKFRTSPIFIKSPTSKFSG